MAWELSGSGVGMGDNARMQQTPTSETPDTWHVLGAGAMGCLWASSLASCGYAVRLLLREPPPQAGLLDIRLNGLDGSSREVQVCADGTGDASPILKLLACTKAPALLPALEEVAHRIAPGAAVVLLQNGMGFHEAVAALLPQARVFCALTTEGAFREGAFTVHHAGRGETLLGAWSQTDAAAAPALAAELGRGGLRVRIAEDIREALWKKLAVNCAINPLTALHGCPNGALLERPALRQEFEALCAELATVLNGLGHTDIATSIGQDAACVAQATAANRSSMRQDLEAGRETEIAFITGFLCERARIAGLPCPLNEALCGAVRERERRAAN
jgi:2-dehydropantoate 2-reductase